MPLNHTNLACHFGLVCTSAVLSDVMVTQSLVIGLEHVTKATKNVKLRYLDSLLAEGCSTPVNLTCQQKFNI